MRPILFGVVLASLAAPASAQQLDPRIATPLLEMINLAGAQCQAGNPQGCGLMQQLQQVGAELTQAQMACLQGNPRACEVLQMGANQVFGTYQQMQGNAVPQIGSGTVSGGGYSSQQMQADHQMRMQQQQGQFQLQQNQAAQQRQLYDEQNRRFIEQLRR